MIQMTLVLSELYICILSISEGDRKIFKKQ